MPLPFIVGPIIAAVTTTATTVAATAATAATTAAATAAAAATTAGAAATAAATTAGAAATAAATTASAAAGAVTTAATELVGSQVARQVGMQAIRTATSKLVSTTAGKVAVGAVAGAAAGGAIYYMYYTYKRTLDEAELDAYNTCMEAYREQFVQLDELNVELDKIKNKDKFSCNEVMHILKIKTEELERHIKVIKDSTKMCRKEIATKFDIHDLPSIDTTKLPHYELTLDNKLVYNPNHQATNLWEFFDFGGKVSAARQHGYNRAAEKCKNMLEEKYKKLNYIVDDINKTRGKNGQVVEKWRDCIIKIAEKINAKMENACYMDARNNISAEKKNR